jgi:hypothetical protein
VCCVHDDDNDAGDDVMILHRVFSKIVPVFIRPIFVIFKNDPYSFILLFVWDFQPDLRRYLKRF